MNKLNDTQMDYLKTFLTTLFIVVMFGVLNIFYMIHNIFNIAENGKQNIDAAFESYLVDILIDRNKDFARTYPKNYAINMRLGILYSYKRDYLNAENEFKNAKGKAVAYDYTPSYQLAKLYIRMNRLKDAQNVMDSVAERPNKRLIKYKGNIYASLGEAYYNQGYYLFAVSKYEKALEYYNVINYKHIKDTKISYIEACVSLADMLVAVNKFDEAIIALEKAYTIDSENVSVNYKLGLLNIDNNPDKAYSLLTFVNKKEPQMMKYEIYYDLLKELSDVELKKGKYTDSELYNKRAEQYKKFVKNNLLYENDLFIDVMKMDVHTDLAAKEYIMNFQFRLQNNSNLDIDNLSVKAIFKDGDKIVQSFTQKIFDEGRIFKAGTMTPPIVISASESYLGNGKKQEHDLMIEVYAYKYPKYRVKLYTQVLKKPVVNP